MKAGLPNMGSNAAAVLAMMRHCKKRWTQGGKRAVTLKQPSTSNVIILTPQAC